MSLYFRLPGPSVKKTGWYGVVCFRASAEILRQNVLDDRGIGASTGDDVRATTLWQFLQNT